MAPIVRLWKDHNGKFEGFLLYVLDSVFNGGDFYRAHRRRLRYERARPERLRWLERRYDELLSQAPASRQ